jgi:hypothetical protein
VALAHRALADFTDPGDADLVRAWLDAHAGATATRERPASVPSK